MRTQTLFALTLAASLLSACGGGSSSPTTPADDSYDQSAFGYIDPNPAAFHPLGKKTSSLMQLDEGMVFFNIATVDGAGPDGIANFAGSLKLREDVHQGSAQLGIDTSTMAKNGFVPLDGCSGDLDGDGVPEAIYTGIVKDQGSHLGIRMSNPTLPATTTHYATADTEEFNYSTWATGVIATHCAAGDLDGDGTDELVVMESLPSATNLRIIKLADDAGTPVFFDAYTTTFTGPIGRVAVGQFDGDDALELVVCHGTAGGKGLNASLVTDLYDDLNTGVVHLDEIAHYTGFDAAIEVVVGEFDGDPLDEITLGVQSWLSTGIINPIEFEHYRTWTNAYDWDPATGSSLIRSANHDSSGLTDWKWDSIGQRRRERFVAADLNEDGMDEVCWLNTTIVNATLPFGYSEILFDWGIALRTWQPVSGAVAQLGNIWTFAAHGNFGQVGSEYRGGDLAVVDDDGSGDDNILVTYTSDELVPGTYARQDLIFDTNNYFTVGYLSGASKFSVPIMAGGDFDGESLRVRYTGVKYQYLPNPTPMVLLAAPPTKAGIDQNTSVTGSSYTVSDGTSEAYTVSTSTSMSFTQGYEVEDLTGTFGASMKETVKSSVEKSTGGSSTLTTSQVFSGAYDDNSIVFEGTLHTMYEYEVVSAVDPTAVGTLVSINVPVATKVFKWTTDFYNQNVDAADQIPADVFPQTIGDPASYPTETALTGLLASNGGSYEGWEGTSIAVGQGSASNGIGLALSTVLSEGETHTYGVEASAEVKLGGAIYGGSVGVSDSYMYEVSVARETSYDGTIGDIAAADWSDWLYDVGMVVYTRVEGDKKPFQVLQYWTETLGPGYQ